MPRLVSDTARSATSGPSFADGGTEGSVRHRIDASSNMITIVNHSTVKPYRDTTTGARMMNPRRNAPLNVKVNSELATSRSPRRTIDGIVAASAGTKKIVTAATRKFTR